MNNNNNGNKGKESDIITKKGFLISLPGKKNASASESSINLAKPQGKISGNGAKNEGGENKNFGKKQNRYDKNNRNGKNNNRQGDAEKENKQQNNNNNSHNNQNNNHNKKDNRRVREVKNEQANSGLVEKKQNDAHNNREDRRDRNKTNKKNKHNNHRHNDRRQQDERQQEQRSLNESKSKAAALSSLSAEIAADEIKSFSETKAFSGVAERELSLEEKYKNAKPLAEQIAEQELRQKGIKIPYDGEKVLAETENQEIVGVRFREAGKIYYFDPAGTKVPFGAPVIVETARGSEYGFTAISNRMIPVESLTAPLKKIERLATPMDTQKHEANKMLEKDAEKVFVEKVEKLKLPMNLIYVEYTFDNSRLLFYFTAETRIDFRELVKELAGVFRTRIELRQIGVRDEAKMLGGLGVCGRATCCNTFLGDFAQVSIKMAKDQSLSLNAAKISGACGKLMCCLRYEDKVYEEENARTPKVGSIVETAEGRGVVVERNALKGIVNVQLELTPEAPAKAFPREEVMVIGFNKDKGDDDIDSEELKHLQDS